jgi:triosephosphate isomerase
VRSTILFVKKTRLVVANWKMYVKSQDRALALARGLRRKTRQFAGTTVVVCPAFPLLPPVGKALKGSALHLGAQALSPFGDEQHTGEVSAAMLKHAGADFCIVGHSERRAMGERDDVIRVELHRAQSEGLMPILCVGEKERDSAGSHFSTITAQLAAALGERSQKNSIKRLVVAYEPVWAIGKSAGDAMKPAELQEMVIFIRKTLADVLGRAVALRTAILYGGSVEEENADLLLAEGGVAGFLVGHASADLSTFLPLLKACTK